ncbi:hypothetical protein IJZ97_06370 [bacterium]|nr:hypothetical protein [bacterium]
MKSNEEIIKEMQEVVAQMVIDDIEEDPSLADEQFECDCCGQLKPLAGSVEYTGYRLCNDCVLIAETGFALNKITDIQQVIDAMEDRRLQQLCDFLKEEEKRETN